jgi:CHAT domain-containing protein
MTAFFQRVTADVRAGRPVAYARALRQAQEAIRRRPGCAAPYHWAPFVLIGPAD